MRFSTGDRRCKVMRAVPDVVSGYYNPKTVTHEVN